MEKREMQIH